MSRARGARGVDALLVAGTWALTVAILGGIAFGYGFARGWWS